LKDYKPLFERFFKKQITPEEYEKILKEIKRSIKKTFKNFFEPQIEAHFKKFYGEDYLQVLAHELFLKFLASKEYFENLEYVNEKYISSCIKNIIYQHLTSKFKIVEKEINFDDIKLEEDPEEEKINLEENLPHYVVDYLETYRIYHIIEIFKEKLTQKEIETLCWYIYKHIYQKEIVVETNKNTLYKRWERLKPKLRDILLENLDEEIPSSRLFDLIMSEICEKINYIKK
jgi:hypothetical protein